MSSKFTVSSTAFSDAVEYFVRPADDNVLVEFIGGEVGSRHYSRIYCNGDRVQFRLITQEGVPLTDWMNFAKVESSPFDTSSGARRVFDFGR